MKRVFIPILLAIITSGFQQVVAQPTTDTTVCKASFYCQLGVTNMGIHGDYPGTLMGKRGYALMVGTILPLYQTSVIKLYYGAECGLTSRGFAQDSSWKKQRTTPHGENITYHYRLKHNLMAHSMYLSPAMLGLQLSVKGNFSLLGHVGVYTSFDYAGKYIEEASIYYMASAGSPTNRTDITETTLSAIAHYRRFDVGTTVGIGFCYDRFQFVVSYQQGLTHLTADYQLQTRNIAFNVGYTF